MFSSLAVILAAGAAVASAQVVRKDSGTYGPALEEVHLFYDEWPTGVAISSTGRLFACYPGGIDMNNTVTATNGKYNVAELFPNNTEVPYPSVDWNSPPMGAINRTTYPVTASNYQDHFIGVQSVVIDASDTLWILDTGRAIDPDTGINALGTYGGAKLVSVNLTTNTVTRTILFPANVSFPDSYLNDVRFDLSSNLTDVGCQGAAYLTDSSTVGRNGLAIVDLETGNSWRHLDGDTRTHPTQGFVPFVWDEPLYYTSSPGQPQEFIPFGSDGIALSKDGETLFWTTLGGRTLYSVPTARLRSQSSGSELAASASVMNRGETGVTDGMETDSNDFIYKGNVEQEEILLYNPANFTTTPFVRDPRINWVDTMTISTTGYLYFTVNQFNYLPSLQAGVDRRQRPFVLFRAPLPNNGTKVLSPSDK